MNNRLRLILITNGIQVFAATLLVPVFALFIKEIGGGPELAGALFAVSFMTTAIGSLVVMRMRDTKILDKELFDTGMIMKLLAWILLAVHQSIPVLITAQIILGISTAIGSPAFGALISENLDRQKHLSEWSKWDFIYNTATGLASISSGFIIVSKGFDFLFLLMAAITLMALIVSLQFKLK